MRATTLAAGGLACAGAAMTIAAFAAGGDGGAATGTSGAATGTSGGAATGTSGAATGASEGAARDGLAVWVAQGCGSCHTFAPAGSRGPIGPDLELTLYGKDRAYIERGIVAPDAEAPPQYSSFGMPDDYATRIAPADLTKLVDFIAQEVGAQ